MEECTTNTIGDVRWRHMPATENARATVPHLSRTLVDGPPVNEPLLDEPLVAIPGAPRLRTIIGRVSLSLLIACFVPAALFYGCLMLFGVWTAILAALGWSYGAILWRRVSGRRTSGLLILTALVLTGRTAVALVSDSTFLYFLQPIISDGVVATTFLLSLASARPMVARLAGDFYPMDHEIAMRPRVRRLFRNLTGLWALLCLGKATITICLLQTQTLETFVLANSISGLSLTALATAATICTAAVVARKEGLLSPHKSTLPPLPAIAT